MAWSALFGRENLKVKYFRFSTRASQRTKTCRCEESNKRFLSLGKTFFNVVQKHDDKNRENFVFERKEVTDCFDTHKLIFHITSYFLAYYKRNIVTIPTPKQNLS
jgi:hypothetical protein